MSVKYKIETQLEQCFSQTLPLALLLWENKNSWQIAEDLRDFSDSDFSVWLSIPNLKEFIIDYSFNEFVGKNTFKKLQEASRYIVNIKFDPSDDNYEYLDYSNTLKEFCNKILNYA